MESCKGRRGAGACGEMCRLVTRHVRRPEVSTDCVTEGNPENTAESWAAGSFGSWVQHLQVGSHPFLHVSRGKPCNDRCEKPTNVLSRVRLDHFCFGVRGNLREPDSRRGAEILSFSSREASHTLVYVLYILYNILVPIFHHSVYSCVSMRCIRTVYFSNRCFDRG